MATDTITKDRKKGHKTRFLCKLFAAQPKAKLTDEQLAKAVIAEYPDSESNWVQRMPALRRLFNNGKLPGQEKRPAMGVPKYPLLPSKVVVKKAASK